MPLRFEYYKKGFIMEQHDDPIDAWLQDLEPDEPLAVPQTPYTPTRRFPLWIWGILALVLVVLGWGALNRGPAREGDATTGASAMPVSQAESTNGTTEPQPTPESGEHEQPESSSAQPPSALGLEAMGSPSETNEPDPYDQPAPGEQSPARQVAQVGVQWMTHASAEEVVRSTVTKTLGKSIDGESVTVHAIQSLPLAGVGRLVQVRTWSADGVQGLWAVPIREDGVAMATPWLVSSQQIPLVDAPPQPSGQIDPDEATAVITKAGWTNVTITASGPHPSIPDVLIVTLTAIPPHGTQPVESTLWLGGPAGARHVMGV